MQKLQVPEMSTQVPLDPAQRRHAVGARGPAQRESHGVFSTCPGAGWAVSVRSVHGAFLTPEQQENSRHEGEVCGGGGEGGQETLKI